VVIPEQLAEEKQIIKTLKLYLMSRSFPASSEMYTQTDCNKKMNINIANTLTNDFRYVLSM
jgi:hypothetical protein